MTTSIAGNSRYRLPATAKPLIYDLVIEPNLKDSSFKGRAVVTVAVAEPLAKITFNAVDLTLTDALLKDDHGHELSGQVTYDKPNEQVSLSFSETVAATEYELSFSFAGIISDKLKGFYRSVYKNAAGGEELIAVTKFEPCDARRAFPCWDEPAFKARFKISLIVDDNLTAISNERVIAEHRMPDGRKRIEFAPTISMSTYLVAYVIGTLKPSKPVKAGKTEVRIWSVPGKEHLHDFALDIGKFSVEHFGEYFDFPYPSQKLDLIAIPDFASGAMENYGCVTFRETALLVDPKTASQAELERVAEVVAHEIAHMWFGDIVTMSWWNGLWLNEAFATFLAAKCVDAWKPEWRTWESFNIQRAMAMKVDGLRETRPIEFPVNNPDEAGGMFDVLTYQKGCAILRMLELFIGPEQFRTGMRHYLQKHQYANADTSDLWAALQTGVSASKTAISLTELMNTWVFQPGYPIIEVSENNGTAFKQQIFRYLPDASMPKSIWQIPINIRLESKSKTRDNPTTICLSQREATMNLFGDQTGAENSLVINSGGHGYFRLHYSDKMQAKILAGLADFSAPERFNFINDLWAAVQAGSAPLQNYMDVLATATRTEDDINVFTLIIGSLSFMRRLLGHERNSLAAFLTLSSKLLSPALVKLGTSVRKGESTQHGQLRAALISALGAYGDRAIIEKSEEIFHHLKKDPASVDGNLAGAAVSALAHNGDDKLYAEFLSLKETAKTPQAEQRYLMALAGFPAIPLAERTLNMCIDGKVRTQDAPYLVRNLLMNQFVSPTPWQFVKENWDKMSAAYPSSGLTRMCEGVTSLIDDKLEQDVKGFFANHEVHGGQKIIAQYIEQLQVACAFANREKQNLQKYLLADA